jgi:hypothetical protein
MATDTEIAYVEEVAESHGVDVEAFWSYCEALAIAFDDCADHVENFREAFIDQFQSDDEFAEYMADEMGLDIPGLVRAHIDWSDVFHCELRHDYFEEGGYYFRNL